MLEINEERKQVTTDLLKKDFGIEKYPVVFKLANRYIKFDKVNNRETKPRSFSFDTFYSVVDPNKGSQVIRYFTNKVSKGGGIYAYAPSDIGFGDGAELKLDKAHLDMIYFLAAHERCATSPHRNSEKAAWFYLEDKAADAKAKVDKRRAKSRANDLLFSENYGLNPERLREVARSFQIGNIDGKTDDQLRIDLDVFARTHTEEFLDRAETKKDLGTLNLISKCVEAGVIKYYPDKKSWYFGTAAKPTKDNKVTDVRAGEDEVERLAEWLEKFDESGTADYLQTKLEEALLVE